MLRTSRIREEVGRRAVTPTADRHGTCRRSSVLTAPLRALRTDAGAARARVAALMELVSLRADFAERHVVVMQRGRTVETAPAERIFAAPQHDYTKLLLGSVPRAAVP